MEKHEKIFNVDVTIVKDEIGHVDLKATLKDPVTALKFMVDAIVTHMNREDFVVDMNYYHSIIEGSRVCVGCAATCVIQELANRELTVADLVVVPVWGKAANYNAAFGQYFEDIDDVENMFNEARMGSINNLFYLFGCAYKVSRAYQAIGTRYFKLEDKVTYQDVLKYAETVKVLEAANLFG